MRKNKTVILLICICLLTGGCSVGAVGTDYAENAAEYSFELPAEEVTISYEVPVAMPNVLVDRLGYEPENNKIVIFKGTELPESFTIRERGSGEIVYTGSVKTKSSSDVEAAYNSYGDFSDFKQVGDYYVQIEHYGESYPFIVHDNLYYSLFKRAFGKLSAMRGGSFDDKDGGWQIAEKGENKEITACLCMYQLLASYEIFPEVYTDDMGIPESGNEIPDVLDECRYEAQWLIYQAQINPDGSGKACGHRAAVLAKYAYLTKTTDAAFAGECLKAAEEAWKIAEKDEFVPDDLLALAAAELYRLTGNAQYKKTAEDYLRVSAVRGSKMSELEFFAGVVYMKTKNKVEVELCDDLIAKLMNEAEKISQRSKQSDFLVCTDQNKTDVRLLLKEVQRICVVNHVITNHEYNTVIENHFHYLMGRNQEALSYVSYWEGQEMQTADLLEDPVDNAAFIFMLSELVSSQISRS